MNSTLVSSYPDLSFPGDGSGHLKAVKEDMVQVSPQGFQRLGKGSQKEVCPLRRQCPSKRTEELRQGRPEREPEKDAQVESGDGSALCS